MQRSAQELRQAAAGARVVSNEAIGGLLGDLTRGVERAAEELKQATETAKLQSNESLAGLISEVARQVSQSSVALRDSADAAKSQTTETVGGLINRLTGDVGAHSAALRAAAASATNHTVETIQGLVGKLRDEVGAASASLTAAAETARTQTAETIAGLSGELGHEIEASTVALREAMERNSRVSVSALTSTNEKLRTELSVLLDRLGQTASGLGRIVADANNGLGSVESGLSARLQEMQKALGAMAAQVTELDRLSLETRDSASDLVERLGGRTVALADIARDLSTKQQTIDLALQHRQSGLEALVGQLSERGQSLHTQLADFTQGIEASLEKAESRAQEISVSLSAVARSTASTVTGQFDAIRNSATSERERTEAALKAIYEQANRQISELLEGSSSRFQQSLDEMRKTAADIQRELESARQDIKRGAIELPKETSEAANAMRRVVSDQIRALKELAEVVGASEEIFDVSEPGPSPRPEPRRSARDDAPPRYSNGANESSELIVAPAPAREPTRLRPTAPAVQAPAYPPQQSAPPPAANGALASERGQSGWLSNLLAAASRDEPRAAQRANGDLLESISAEIARLVDPEAAAELWERWRGGETGAISRRLYTSAGQQTFDDIRRRYRAEGPFRDFVNRYVQEFERLLAKIGHNDRDGAQARLAMLSDSGKVYIMLAHAAGRLG